MARAKGVGQFDLGVVIGERGRSVSLGYARSFDSEAAILANQTRSHCCQFADYHCLDDASHRCYAFEQAVICPGGSSVRAEEPGRTYGRPRKQPQGEIQRCVGTACSSPDARGVSRTPFPGFAVVNGGPTWYPAPCHVTADIAGRPRLPGGRS